MTLTLKDMVVVVVVVFSSSSSSLFYFIFSWDKVSLCSPDCPGTYYVDQANLKLSEVYLLLPLLRLKACLVFYGLKYVCVFHLFIAHTCTCMIMFVLVCMCVCVYIRGYLLAYRSQSTACESRFLSLAWEVSSGLSDKYIYQLSHLASPLFIFLKQLMIVNLKNYL